VTIKSGTFALQAISNCQVDEYKGRYRKQPTSVYFCSELLRFKLGLILASEDQHASQYIFGFLYVAGSFRRSSKWFFVRQEKA